LDEWDNKNSKFDAVGIVEKFKRPSTEFWLVEGSTERERELWLVGL